MALGHGTVAIAQFTSTSTAAIVSISLGFVPDFAIVVQDAQGTNPLMRFWVNRANFNQWQAGADDTILLTGDTSGGTDALTLDTASISAYTGGDVVSATDVTNRRYAKRDGSLYAANDITGAGLTIPAGDQTNSGKNFIFAWRNDA